MLPLVLIAVLAPAPLQEPSSTDVDGGYEDGFFVRSADGAHELVLEGLFQVLFGYQGEDRDPSVDVELKRFRPELAGRFARRLIFRFEPRFTEDDVELEEAWIGFEIAGGDARVLLGRMKAPFGLEEVRSRRWIDFPTFSILNQFSPAEDHGAFLYGRTSGRVFEYGIAAYNGTGASDSNGSKDVAVRAMVHPFADGAPGGAELQLGVAATIGDQRSFGQPGAIENEVGQAMTLFLPNAELDGQRTRLGVEAAWFSGPWFAQGELLYTTRGIRSGLARRDVTVAGAYLTVSRALTGERKTFGGLDPAEPFDFDDRRGRGAWVVAARYSELRFDHTLQPFTVPGTFVDEVSTASLGLNWIPNRHAIVRNALVWTDYSRGIAVGNRSVEGELAFVIETQLHF